MKLQLPPDKLSQAGPVSPIVMVTCVDAEGKPNIITMGLERFLNIFYIRPGPVSKLSSRRLGPEIREDHPQGKHSGGKFPPDKSRDLIARYVGVSGRTLEKAKRIRAYGFTQREVSETLGVTRQTVDNWESESNANNSNAFIAPDLRVLIPRQGLMRRATPLNRRGTHSRAAEKRCLGAMRAHLLEKGG